MRGHVCSSLNVALSSMRLALPGAEDVSPGIAAAVMVDRQRSSAI